jgi:aminopeptidase N
MEWWSQLWLNEGFATFVGNLATDHLFPQWNIWTLFVNDYQFTAFGLDGKTKKAAFFCKTSQNLGWLFNL